MATDEKTITLPDELEIYRVHWIDPCNHPGWMNRAEVIQAIQRGCLKMESIGWLVYKDDELVVLAMTSGEDRVVGDLMTIPMAVVTEIYKLDQSNT